jgi:hypothetical protein
MLEQYFQWLDEMKMSSLITKPASSPAHSSVPCKKSLFLKSPPAAMFQQLKKEKLRRLSVEPKLTQLDNALPIQSPVLNLVNACKQLPESPQSPNSQNETSIKCLSDVNSISPKNSHKQASAVNEKAGHPKPPRRRSSRFKELSTTADDLINSLEPLDFEEKTCKRRRSSRLQLKKSDCASMTKPTQEVTPIVQPPADPPDPPLQDPHKTARLLQTVTDFPMLGDPLCPSRDEGFAKTESDALLPDEKDNLPALLDCSLSPVPCPSDAEVEHADEKMQPAVEEGPNDTEAEENKDLDNWIIRFTKKGVVVDGHLQ